MRCLYGYFLVKSAELGKVEFMRNLKSVWKKRTSVRIRAQKYCIERINNSRKQFSEIKIVCN